MTAVLLVFQLGQPRILMSMSRDGLLPPLFARVSPRFGTPAVSTVLTGIVVCAFSALANIAEIVNLVNIGTLFAFIIVCVGTLVLRSKEPALHRPFRVRWLWPVAIGGMVTCAYLMTTLGPENWSRLALWFVVGLNVYFAFGFPRSIADAGARAAFTRTACAVFAVAMALLALFLWKGDAWLSSPSGPGGPTLWDKWIGFPPGLSHGIAIFLLALFAWNVVGCLRRAR
jgi:APA family basic amino acid/polyamine antiporter